MEKGVRNIPQYEVEFLIYNGELIQNTLVFPFSSNKWKIRYPNGARMCFLPANYSVEGPVTLIFKKGVEAIKIVGSKFELKIVKQKADCIAYAVT